MYRYNRSTRFLFGTQWIEVTLKGHLSRSLVKIDYSNHKRSTTRKISPTRVDGGPKSLVWNGRETGWIGSSGRLTDLDAEETIVLRESWYNCPYLFTNTLIRSPSYFLQRQFLNFQRSKGKKHQNLNNVVFSFLRQFEVFSKNFRNEGPRKLLTRIHKEKYVFSRIFCYSRVF